MRFNFSNHIVTLLLTCSLILSFFPLDFVLAENIEDSTQDLTVIYNDHGEYLLKNTTAKNESFDKTNSYTIKKIRNEIYQLEETDTLLLKVSDTQLLEVGSISIDLTDEDDLKRLSNSNVGQALKEQVLASAEENSEKLQDSSSPIITIYSPNLISPESIGNGNYFYYTGKGGFTYKQEFLVYDHLWSDTESIYYDSGRELQQLANHTIEFVIDTGIGSIPYWGTAYSLVKFFGQELFDQSNVEMLDSTRRDLVAEENDAEIRYCYIRGNFTGSMEDHLKALSSRTQVNFYERLFIPGKPMKESELVIPTYKGDYFDSLDVKAYDYRQLEARYDSMLYSITHDQTGVEFDLYPSIAGNLLD